MCYNKGTVRERKKDTSMKANRTVAIIINVILTIINIITPILLAWLVVSTIEVVSKNLDANPIYTVWNIYNLIG